LPPQLSPEANSEEVRNDHKDSPRTETEVPRGRTMTYLRFACGYGIENYYCCSRCWLLHLYM